MSGAMSEEASFRRVDPLLSPPQEDAQLLTTYDSFSDKGVPESGYRLTLMTATPSVAVGEVIRIVHVCESVSASSPLYVMGPKPVWGEYVDDVLATDLPPDPGSPFELSSYDGRVLPGPGVDINYEVTRYQFTDPGVHTVQWRLEPTVSNVLRFTVS